MTRGSARHSLHEGAGFQYDAESGPLATLCNCGASVAPAVLRRVDFWLFFLVHLAVFALSALGEWPEAAWGVETKLDWDAVKVVTALTTFFEVFYTNNCFGRYLALYKSTRLIFVEAADISAELHAVLKQKGHAYARLTLRYVLASLALFFDQEISTGAAGCGIPDEKLLKPDELAFLRKHTGSQSLLVMHWAGEVFLLGAREVGLPDNVQKNVLDKLCGMMAHERKMADTFHLSAPFQYYHLLCLMVVVCVTSWAIQMGTEGSWGGIAVFFVAEFIFMGMIELASQLADPYGDDAVDFPWARWLRECCAACEATMEGAPQADGAPGAWHAALARERCLDLGFERLGDGGGGDARRGVAQGAGQEWQTMLSRRRLDYMPLSPDADDDP